MFCKTCGSLLSPGGECKNCKTASKKPSQKDSEKISSKKPKELTDVLEQIKKGVILTPVDKLESLANEVDGKYTTKIKRVIDEIKIGVYVTYFCYRKNNPFLIYIHGKKARDTTFRINTNEIPCPNKNLCMLHRYDRNSYGEQICKFYTSEQSIEKAKRLLELVKKK